MKRFLFAIWPSFVTEPAPSGPGPTADSDGTPPNKEVLDQFRGQLSQVPPAVSAKKIAGRPAYELARKKYADISVFYCPLDFSWAVRNAMCRIRPSILVLAELELWPNLIRGGGMMRQYALQIQTKDGNNVDYRKINWATTDIRNYEVIQPPGPKSVLGHVKFSFPSQHTIYMHDTPDKWMFRPAQRTLSHGCLRVPVPDAASIFGILQPCAGGDTCAVWGRYW